MNLICRVQFDTDAVEAGDQLKGRLKLLEDSSSVKKADRLRLRAICRVTGPGEPEFRVLSTTELPGPFKAQTDIPFRVPIPPQGPMSYQGIILRLSWHLSVELLVPGEYAPKYETDFQVIPARRSAERRGVPKAPPTRR